MQIHNEISKEKAHTIFPPRPNQKILSARDVLEYKFFHIMLILINIYRLLFMFAFFSDWAYFYVEYINSPNSKHAFIR